MSDDTLTVLVGAGASFDCVNPYMTTVDPDYRPPLVKHLFEPRKSFSEVLNRYPKAEALSTEIRIRLQHSQLEDILQHLAQESHPLLRRQFWHVPLYLQELLGRVSHSYIQRGSSHFDVLLRAIVRSNYRSALFLTTNYDLFLERAFANLLGPHMLLHLPNYLSLDRMALVKLHGSISWAHPILNDFRDRTEPLRVLLEGEGADLRLDRDVFQIVNGYDDNYRRIGTDYFYPAMAIPVAGKVGFVCPPDHVKYARTFLPDCENFLLLGFSALDEDVLAELKSVKSVRRLLVADGGRPSGTAILERLVKANANFMAGGPIKSVFEGGFNDLVTSGSLHTFLEVD